LGGNKLTTRKESARKNYAHSQEIETRKRLRGWGKSEKKGRPAPRLKAPGKAKSQRDKKKQEPVTKARVEAKKPNSSRDKESHG